LIAKELASLLEAEGASVVLTRQAAEEVPLEERPKRAWQARAHLYVSIHNDAAPDGVNPYEEAGFSVYYYHPQSRALAQALYQSYVRSLGLADHGFWYRNLAVCRMTQMPAVLTEQAFLILPEQEAMLLTPEFRRKCARTILSGIRSFLKGAL